MTLNQLLVEMDGFENNNGRAVAFAAFWETLWACGASVPGVVVICATNFPESLDKARPGDGKCVPRLRWSGQCRAFQALTRPGRLDRQIVVPIPDLKGRMAGGPSQAQACGGRAPLPRRFWRCMPPS